MHELAADREKAHIELLDFKPTLEDLLLSELLLLFFGTINGP